MTNQITAFMNGNANLQQLQKKLPMISSLVLVIACAHMLAKITWMAIPLGDNAAAPVRTAPQRGAQVSNQGVRELTGAHLFGVSDQATATKATRAPVTRLNLVLRGVVAAEPMSLSHAIVARGKNGKEEVYSIGDKIPGGVTVKEIHPDHIVLNRGGRLEVLKLARDESVGSVSSGRAANFRASGSPGAQLANIRSDILRNPASFGDYAIPVIVKEQGKQVGYRLQPQQKGQELLGQLGLLSGDVITEINGIKLNNPKNGVGALRSLTTAKALRLRVKRGGSEVPLNIQLQ